MRRENAGPTVAFFWSSPFVVRDPRRCRYEAEKKKGTFDKEEARRSHAKTVLQRYTHHYERYYAHEQAQKRTAEEQGGALTEAMRHIEECTRCLLYTSPSPRD